MLAKSAKKTDDYVQTFTHELRYPATTQPNKLAEVSTYHSIEVISQAQSKHGLEPFDLVVWQVLQALR